MKYQVKVSTMCLKCGKIEKSYGRTFKSQGAAERWMDDEHDKLLASSEVASDGWLPNGEGYLTEHGPKLQTAFEIMEVG